MASTTNVGAPSATEIRQAKRDLIGLKASAKALRETRMLLGACCDSYKLSSKKSIGKGTVTAATNRKNACKAAPRTHDQGCMTPHVYVALVMAVADVLTRKNDVQTKVGADDTAYWVAHRDELKAPAQAWVCIAHCMSKEAHNKEFNITQVMFQPCMAGQRLREVLGKVLGAEDALLMRGPAPPSAEERECYAEIDELQKFLEIAGVKQGKKR